MYSWSFSGSLAIRGVGNLVTLLFGSFKFAQMLFEGKAAAVIVSGIVLFSETGYILVPLSIATIKFKKVEQRVLEVTGWER